MLAKLSALDMLLALTWCVHEHGTKSAVRTTAKELREKVGGKTAKVLLNMILQSSNPQEVVTRAADNYLAEIGYKRPQ